MVFALYFWKGSDLFFSSKKNAMKKFLLLFGLSSALFSSCTQQRYATGTSSYENDEVYLTSDDTYISDFAIVDNEPEQNGQTTAPADYVDPNSIDDDYYGEQSTESVQEEYYSDGSMINNYYGDVYQDQSGFGQNNSFGYYNNSWNNWGSNSMLIWNPYSGWRLRYNWGYGYGCFGGFYNNPWGWNTPWYDPWFGNSWCSNNWNSGFGIYDPWGWNSPYYCGNFWGNNNWYGNNYWNNNNWNNNGWTNNDGSGGGGIVFGPRPTISVGSSINSSYDNGTLVSHSAKKPGLAVGIDPTVSVNYSKPLQKPTDAVSAIDKIPSEAKESVYNVAQLSEAAYTPVSSVNPTSSQAPAASQTNVNSATVLDKPLEIERESTKPAVAMQPTGTTVTTSKEDDYYTLPRPKPAAAKPSYVSEKPSSRGNSTTSTKPSNNSSTNSERPSSAPSRTGSAGYERETVKPSGSNSSAQNRKPEAKPEPSRTDSKPSYTPPKPSNRESRPAPSYTPNSSKPSGGSSGGSTSPGRSSSGGKSSGGKSAGGSSSGGGRKK